MSTKTNGQSAATATTGKTTLVAELPKVGTPLVNPPAVIKKEEPELPPVEDRIFKVQQLSLLVEKHDTLLETQKKLKAFKLSSDGSRDTLRIQDSRGNDFTTSNSAVIADVIETLKTSLAAKISDLENQIRF